MPDSPAPGRPTPLVTRHEMPGLPTHWDVTFPCCEAEAIDVFGKEAEACHAAEQHVCREDVAITELESDPPALPGLDLAAIRANYLRAAETYSAAEDFVAQHLRKRSGPRQNVAVHVEALQEVAENVPEMVATLERVRDFATSLLESPTSLTSHDRAAKALIALLNLKEKIA